MPQDNTTSSRSDRARYGPRPWLREQSFYAVLVYRFGRRTLREEGLAWSIARRAYWPLYRLVETLSGISLPRTAVIGPGLRIWHFGGVIVHEEAQIGANCTLRHGVTIGNRTEGGPVPVIGDDVSIGAYAQILGGVHIGDGAQIGAMSVVLDDVPAGATAVGIPARIIPAA